MVYAGRCSATICAGARYSATRCGISNRSGTRYSGGYPKISVASHEIPWHPFCYEMTVGMTHKGATKTPRRKVRFHTGPTCFSKKGSGALRAASPPGGMRSWTRPSDGTDGGLSSGSRSIRRFHFKAADFISRPRSKRRAGRVRPGRDRGRVGGVQRRVQPKG